MQMWIFLSYCKKAKTYREIDMVLPETENPYLLPLNIATPKSYSDKSTHFCPHTCKKKDIP